MEVQLKTFLGNYAVKSKTGFTHTTKLGGGWLPGKYSIRTEDEKKKFNIYYCNAISKNIKPTITERSEGYTPLRLDFDMESEIENGTNRKYTTEHLKKAIAIIQDEIHESVPEECFVEDFLECIVLEKPAPRVEKGKVKDGFHLHFPFFICDRWLQDEYFRKRFIRRFNDEGVFRDCNYVTSVEKMIDKIASKPWMMYGSLNYKNPNSLPYMYNRWSKVPKEERYGHAFNSNLEEIKLEKMFQDLMVGRNKSVKYYLPQFLSIRGYDQPSPLKDIVLRAKRLFDKKVAERKARKPKKRTEEEVAEDIKFITDNGIMDMLNDSRAADYNEWMNVGWTLYNISDGSDLGLELWIKFSARWDKFEDQKECEELWSKMEYRENKTMGSLIFMAKNDSPEEYQQMRLTHLDTHIQRTLYRPKPNEWDVAMVVVQMYKGRFLCANDTKNEWWEFRNHRWRKNGRISIKRLMSTEVWTEYDRYCQKLEERRRRNNGEDEDDGGSENSNKIKKYIKRIWAIQDLLKQDPFKKKVLEACKENLFNEDFHRLRDENPNLLCCENGVLDLELEKFREGRPDDFITYSTNIHFQEYDINDEEVIEYKDYVRKVFPNQNRRNYFLDFMTSLLKGGNIHKRFLVFTGSGDNAKSITCNLIGIIFGDYAQTLPRETFIKAGNSGVGPKPHLSSVRGKRALLLSELTPGDEINYGLVKEMTGNDSFWARGMYEAGGEIKPMFTLVLQCNEPPRVPGQDEATWNRIRVLDYESTFVRPVELEKIPVPDSEKEQFKLKRFKADLTFKDRLPDMAPVALWYAFNRFKEKRGLYEPPEVMQATEIYKTNNDIYQLFIQDKIVRIEDEEEAKESFVTEAMVYDEFREWYRDNYPNMGKKDSIGKRKLVHEIKSRIDFDKDLEEKLYYHDGKKKKFCGYQIFQEESEEINNNLSSILKR